MDSTRIEVIGNRFLEKKNNHVQANIFPKFNINNIFTRKGGYKLSERE